jgi:hypothetical protein
VTYDEEELAEREGPAEQLKGPSRPMIVMTSECRLTCLVLTPAEGAMLGRPTPVGEALAAFLTAESGADNEYARNLASSGGRERACARI